MEKVAIYTRDDLVEDYWPRDPKGFALHSFHCGLNKQMLLAHPDKFHAHGDPYIAVGAVQNIAWKVYKFLTKNNFSFYKGKYYFPIPWNPVHNELDLGDVIDIPVEHLENVRNGRCKILMINHMEGWDHGSFFKIAIDFIKQRYNLSYSNFVMLTGNMKEPEYGAKNVYYNWWEQQYLGQSSFNVNDYGREGLFHLPRKNRQHKFVCLNRRPHKHRIILASLLSKYRHKGVLTCHKIVDDNTLVWDQNINEIMRYLDKLPDDTIQKITELENILPLTFNDGIDANTENPTIDLKVEKFYDSYLHIVTETYLPNDQNFFSEKIFKPIIFMQPFILIGAQNDLKCLRKLGYKTFDGIIDETYDTIEDEIDRFSAAYKEIENIINKSDKELNQMYFDCYDILVHNYWHWVYRTNTMHIDLKNNLLEAL